MNCELCGEPMPEGEQMFKYHGYSGPCPKPPIVKKPMTFSERNLKRCEDPKGFNHPLHSWTLSDWMTATTGEVGEAANVIKKLNRIRDGIRGNGRTEEEYKQDLADELADIYIYLDLMAQAAGFDLNTIVAAKFEKTNKKLGYIEE